MSEYIDKSALVAEIERIKREECPIDTYEGRCKLFWFEQFLSFLNALEVKEVQEEPVSEDLEEAANDYAHDLLHDVFESFIAGAKWQKEHLWKPADGDDLPDIDREVIVLYQRYPLENNEYAVGFAHRPPEYWDGRNIETNEITRYYPKRYDKGGWNIPDVKWWLDLELPIYRKGE